MDEIEDEPKPRVRGLDPPERVRSYTEAYRVEMDPLAGWLDDRAELSPEFWSASKELRESYELWAAANGEKPR